MSGESHFVQDKKMEIADLYKTSKLKILEHSNLPESASLPWLGIVPKLEIYRERSHRRLNAET